MFSKSIFGKYIRIAGAVAIATLAPLSAEAFDMGRYRLHSHDDGSLIGQGSPAYGLRMDELFGGGAVSFNFDGPNSEVYLEYKDNTVHIFGQAAAYEKIGGSFQAAGDWDIDMTYTIDEVTGGGLRVNTSIANGTITEVGGLGRSFDIKNKANNETNPFSFKIAKNHRGESEYSGWGWVSKKLPDDEYLRGPTQDFLFKVGKKVPEPGTLLGLLGVGALGLGSAVKRQQQQDS